MISKLGNYSIILEFFLFTVGAFLLLIFVVTFIWGFLLFFKFKLDYWIMFEATATALAASSVFGAAIVAHRELTESSYSRYIEIANQLFNELNSDENIKARRWIFQNLPEDPAVNINTISCEGREAIKKVLNSLDHVAFLTQEKWIPEDLVMPWMHPMIFKSWKKLEPYVFFERNRRKEPYYYLYASRLAEKCIEWRRKNLQNPDDALWFNDAL